MHVYFSHFLHYMHLCGVGYCWPADIVIFVFLDCLCVCDCVLCLQTQLPQFSPCETKKEF